jgi:hypothetical protein
MGKNTNNPRHILPLSRTITLDFIVYLALLWVYIQIIWWHITHLFSDPTPVNLRIPQEPWKRTFKNMPDWCDKKKKETYERYVSELASDRWLEYSIY